MSQPEQAPLFAPLGERDDDALLTKGGRVVEIDRLIDRRIPCRVCGKPKTGGLPCPWCAMERRDG